MQYGRSSKNKPPQLNPLIETNVEKRERSRNLAADWLF